MRIVKLSKEVFGFDTKDGCIAYFQHVLPWQKERFNIMGEGHHIAPDGLKSNEIVVFSYDGNIVCIARTDNIMVDPSKKKVVAIILKEGTRRVFADPPSLQDLENVLRARGMTSNLVKSQGWNIIDEILEKDVIHFLAKHDWKEFNL